MSNTSFLAIPIDDSGESTRIVRIGLFITFVLVGGFILWAFLAPISGAVIASARVKIDTNRKAVQHFDGGIIKEILVREGSLVEKGDILFRLEDTSSSANLNILNDQRIALLVKEARLNAERNLLPALAFADDFVVHNTSKVAEIMANEKSAFDSKRKTLDEQIELLNEGKRQAKFEISGISTQIAATEENIELIKKQFNASESLIKKGFVQQSQVWQIKRSWAELKEKRASLTTSIAEAREKIADYNLRIITLKNTYVEEAKDSFKENKKEIFDIEQRLRPAKKQLERHSITAPISGQVIHLEVSTIGGVISPGQQLLEIVPAENDLIIEAKGPPQSIDSLYVGQKADIQFLAFNHRTTPLVNGEVVYISGDTLADDNPGSTDNSPYYLVHIRVTDEALLVLGELSLFPGMPAVAFIKTKEKTFADYMIAPIMDNLRRSFREE